MTKQIFIPLIMLALFALQSCDQSASTTTDSDTTDTTVINASNTEDAPLKTLKADNQDIHVFDTDGIQPYLNKEDDNIHVVNFWATWCGPCVKELPYFEQANAEMDDLQLTLVSLDFEDKLESSLVPFVNKKDLKGDVIVVLPESEPELMESVSSQWTSGIPATLIYNKHKRQFYEGSMSYDQLMAEIEKFKL